MRILYVTAGIPVPGSHGGSVHTIELARGLVRRGHEVHLVALPSEGPAEGRDDSLEWLRGIHFHPIRRLLPINQLEWTAYRQVRRIARAVRPEIVVERFYAFGGAGLLAARGLGVPAVSEVHTPARPYPGSWRDRLDALTLVRPVDRWRRTQQRWAAGFYGQAALVMPVEHRDGFVEVVSGADCNHFQPGPPAADAGPLKCVYLSSFRAWHGAEDLVGAVALCAEQGVDVKVSCLGDGPRLKAARSAARAAGVEDRMKFLGAVPHSLVPDHLADADVGLAPFNLGAHSALKLGWYWSPVKLFEFLAAGLAIITTDVDYLREHLTDVAARFYRSGDVRALAAAIASLAGDRAAVRAMGHQARRLATTRYSWSRQAELVEKLLVSVLARHYDSRPIEPGLGFRHC